MVVHFLTSSCYALYIKGRGCQGNDLMIWVCVEFELLVVHFLTSGCYQRQSRQVRSFDEVGVCLV